MKTKPRYFYRVTWLQVEITGVYPFMEEYAGRLFAKIRRWSLRHTPGVENVNLYKITVNN